MELSQITLLAAFRRIAVLLGRWTKFRARPQVAPGARSILAEIERLAILSPHLLADLGFRADPHAAGLGNMAWRKDDMTVTVETFGRSVRASKAGRASRSTGQGVAGEVGRHAV